MESNNPNSLIFSLSSSNSYPTTCGLSVDKKNGGQPKFEDFLGGSELNSFAGGGRFPEDEIQVAAMAAVAAELPVKKGTENSGHRTSVFRGVTRHRWTGRFEAHMWDSSCRREGQSRKGRQGGYDKEEKAARAYDLAALKYWGPTTTTNFPVTDYKRELEEMKHMSRQEFVAALRRKSSGFSRGASIYRGVTRHHQHGRWQARIGRVSGNRDLYLGTFSTQEEAAEAYDIAAIKFRGLNAVTNFDMSRYDVISIATNNLPVGGTMVNKPKISLGPISNNRSVDGTLSTVDANKLDLYSPSFPFSSQNSLSTLNFAMPVVKQVHQQSSNLWAALGFPNPSPDLLDPFQGSNTSGTSVQGTTPYNMEFVPNLSIDSENDSSNNEGFFNGCGYNYREQGNIGGTSSSSLEKGTTHDAVVSGDVNWVTSAPPQLAAQSLQAGKPSLSAFRRPIFGME
ncbi:AP2-like ethylene-responsive transcription factor [Striga asiatica]|uniref:AP2-like ethylene-responsive transcription factor n=1 Tax=Striga asiatica TaxID=4170 RepID=A0A5A7R8H5_STRAF|nr:AP2-like ethylene-responsive transcription factor [Striga asiatica]